ncbi:VOC family protein [Prauserella oleivorans]|uniref:VOC family protein n=1 Tax=Prauserella oleivorans TaxID=1478153 RepID=A0ABW5WGK7_9PSEU
MVTRLSGVVAEARDPSLVARFWAELLGWRRMPGESGAVRVSPTEGDASVWDLVVVPSPREKQAKNRIHVDLASASAGEQRSLVDRALRIGATRADIGQGDLPWEVLADPEGNEFCVLEPRPEYADTGPVAAVVLDARDPHRLGRFWAAVTGWEIVRQETEFVSLGAPGGRGPWLEMLRNEQAPPPLNRWWFELATDNGADREARRLRELGAEPAGADDSVSPRFTDPEGNAFSVVALVPR